jgi:amidase
MRRNWVRATGAVSVQVGVVSCALAVSLSSPTEGAAELDGVAPEPTIAEIHSALAGGRTSVHHLATHYARRIAKLDSQGPALHAVLELNPDALAQAARLDAAGGSRGPLYGVPVLLKDNIDTADRMLTTAGSLALVDSRPTRDAFIVRRLSAAGALLLGKTNLSEWANYRSRRSTSGWSGRGGQTRNPYILDRNPCGSSSGAGVAVAADLAPVAIGTETDGSIICPASVNGVVGIKPTVGLVSRTGIIPIAVSQDTAGPLARTVADAAVVLSAIAGYDPDDPATAPLREKPPIDYRDFLDRDGLRGARIGVLRHFAGFHEEADALFERALSVLRAQGAVLVDPVELPNADKLDADEQIVLAFEFKDGINRYLATRTSGPRTLADLIAFNNRQAAREMPFFGQELFLDAQSRGDLSDAHYREARERAHRLAGAEGLDAALARDHLDALVAPSVGPGWTNDPVNGDHVLGGGVTSPAAVAGYPHLTVPMGAVHQLPVGMSFLGAAWSEGKLIRYAYAYEQASRARRPPQYLRTVK